MIGEPKTLVVKREVRLDGYLIGFSEGAGTWFYTPDEPPEDIEEEATSERIDRKSRNFQTKREAIAFGLGFEKDVERRL